MPDTDKTGLFESKRAYCARWVALTSLISGAPGFFLSPWYLVLPSLLISGLTVGYLVQPFFMIDRKHKELTRWQKLKSAFGMCLSALLAMPVFILLMAFATNILGIENVLTDWNILDVYVLSSTAIIIYIASIMTGILIYPTAFISGLILQRRWSKNFQDPETIDAEIFA